MDTTIMEDPSQFPLLPRSQYQIAHQHLERIRDNLLASGKVRFKNSLLPQVNYK